MDRDVIDHLDVLKDKVFNKGHFKNFNNPKESRT